MSKSSLKIEKKMNANYVCIVSLAFIITNASISIWIIFITSGFCHSSGQFLSELIYIFGLGYFKPCSFLLELNLYSFFSILKGTEQLNDGIIAN